MACLFTRLVAVSMPFYEETVGGIMEFAHRVDAEQIYFMNEPHMK